VILGSAGAGKTQLARSIAGRAGLPVVHLDLLFWRPGWIPAPRGEAYRRLAAAIERPQWILDGNFLPENGAQDPRFGRADTVIFLDVSRTRCLWRVVSRLLRDRGRARADLPEGCSEGFDFPLLRWIWSYPAVDRPRVLELLEGLDERTTVHHLRSRSDVDGLLSAIDAAPE